MTSMLLAASGLLLFGGAGLVLGLISAWVFRVVPGPEKVKPPRYRTLLLLVLVELKSGQSVLGALQSASARIPEDDELRRLARIAEVSGPVAALAQASDRTRPLIAQLARSQRTGASLAGAVMRLLEQDIAADRARRIAAARSLPVKLMIPITLLVLPGLVLLMYAPALVGFLRNVAGPFG